MPITIDTVIRELELIQQLAGDVPKDPRLKDLIADAKKDLAIATQGMGADDPILNKG